jgi:hypothetical protein
MIKEFSTIHIFAYGEAQIIGKDLNFKASVNSFTKLADVIADIKTKKPADITAGDYHAINIFHSIDCRYMGKSKENSFSCKLSDLNEVKLNALIDEFATLKAAAPAKNAASTPKNTPSV